MNKHDYERLTAHEAHEAAPEPLTIDDSEFARLMRENTELKHAISTIADTLDFKVQDDAIEQVKAIGLYVAETKTCSVERVMQLEAKCAEYETMLGVRAREIKAALEADDNGGGLRL